MKLLDKLNGLFTKMDNQEQRYEKALEEKEESLLVLQAEIQDKQIEINDLMKMKLLGDITESTFDEKNKKFQLLQEKYAEAQKEIQLIQEFKHEDVLEILEELKATQREYSPSQREAVNKMGLELLDAKLTYLNKMVEMRKLYSSTVSPSYKIQQIEQKLGLKQHIYYSGSHESLHQYSIGGSYINLRIDNPDVYNALSYGQIDGQLQHVVNDAKAKGTIK